MVRWIQARSRLPSDRGSFLRRRHGHEPTQLNWQALLLRQQSAVAVLWIHQARLPVREHPWRLPACLTPIGPVACSLVLSLSRTASTRPPAAALTSLPECPVADLEGGNVRSASSAGCRPNTSCDAPTWPCAQLPRHASRCRRRYAWMVRSSGIGYTSANAPAGGSDSSVFIARMLLKQARALVRAQLLGRSASLSSSRPVRRS